MSGVRWSRNYLIIAPEKEKRASVWFFPSAFSLLVLFFPLSLLLISPFELLNKQYYDLVFSHIHSFVFIYMSLVYKQHLSHNSSCTDLDYI